MNGFNYIMQGVRLDMAAEQKDNIGVHWLDEPISNQSPESARRSAGQIIAEYGAHVVPVLYVGPEPIVNPLTIMAMFDPLDPDVFHNIQQMAVAFAVHLQRMHTMLELRIGVVKEDK